MKKVETVNPNEIAKYPIQQYPTTEKIPQRISALIEILIQFNLREWKISLTKQNHSVDWAQNGCKTKIIVNI